MATHERFVVALERLAEERKVAAIASIAKDHRGVPHQSSPLRPRKRSEKASCVIVQSSRAVSSATSARGASSGHESARSQRRFQGQTVWQMSQPNSLWPIAGRSGRGIGPRSSMVR